MTRPPSDSIEHVRTARRSLQFQLAFFVLILVILLFLYFSTSTFETPATFIIDLKHFLVTILAVTIGAFIDRYLLFREWTREFSRQLVETEQKLLVSLAEKILPMSKTYNLDQIIPNVSIGNLIDGLDSGQQLDILITFHPDIDRYFSNLIKRIVHDDISCRLLIGNPDSDPVKRRFTYITESQGYSWVEGMVVRLRAFIDGPVKNAFESNRALSTNNRLKVKTFSVLADVPLIIVRQKPESGKASIQYVLQGFYLESPALESPFLRWTPGSDHRSGVDDQSMCELLARYFDKRWDNADDVA